MWHVLASVGSLGRYREGRGTTMLPAWTVRADARDSWGVERMAAALGRTPRLGVFRGSCAHTRGALLAAVPLLPRFKPCRPCPNPHAAQGMCEKRLPTARRLTKRSDV